MDSFRTVLSRVRAACEKYDMIAEGASVAVGVSGGKDSLVTLAALSAMREFYPKHYTLTALTADPCFLSQQSDYSEVERWCADNDVRYIIRRTRLYEIVFEERKEKNPCSLCSRMRRGILHTMAVEAGCDTVALGHHSDDAAETLMMNLLCGGCIKGLPPKTYLDRRGITLIRPLFFCDEQLCTTTSRKLCLPVVASRCPVDGDTERKRVREIIEQLSERYPDIKSKLSSANPDA